MLRCGESKERSRQKYSNNVATKGCPRHIQGYQVSGISHALFRFPSIRFYLLCASRGCVSGQDCHAYSFIIRSRPRLFLSRSSNFLSLSCLRTQYQHQRE